jgi:AraC-like DNA-binding protein
MEMAKGLLEKTDRSITEIAFDVGYEYSSNFTTAFKRHFGITPSTAREALRHQGR